MLHHQTANYYLNLYKTALSTPPDESIQAFRTIRNSLVGSRALKELFLSQPYILESLITDFIDHTPQGQSLILDCLCTLVSTFPSQCTACTPLLIQIISSSSQPSPIVLRALKALSAVVSASPSLDTSSLVPNVLSFLSSSCPSTIKTASSFLLKLDPDVLFANAGVITEQIGHVFSHSNVNHFAFESLLSILHILAKTDSTSAELVSNLKIQNKSLIKYLLLQTSKSRKSPLSSLTHISLLSSLHPTPKMDVDEEGHSLGEYVVYHHFESKPFCSVLEGGDEELLLRHCLSTIWNCLKKLVETKEDLNVISSVLGCFADLISTSKSLQLRLLNSNGIEAVILIIEQIIQLLHQFNNTNCTFIPFNTVLNTLRIITILLNDSDDLRMIVFTSGIIKDFLFSFLLNQKPEKPIDRLCISFACLALRNWARYPPAVLQHTPTLEELSSLIPLITFTDTLISIQASSAFANISTTYDKTKNVVNKELIGCLVSRVHSGSPREASIACNVLVALCRDGDEQFFSTVLTELGDSRHPSLMTILQGSLKLEALALVRNLAWSVPNITHHLLSLFGDPSPINPLLAFLVETVSCACSSSVEPYAIRCATKSIYALSNISCPSDDLKSLVVTIPNFVCSLVTLLSTHYHDSQLLDSIILYLRTCLEMDVVEPIGPDTNLPLVKERCQLLVEAGLVSVLNDISTKVSNSEVLYRIREVLGKIQHFIGSNANSSPPISPFAEIPPPEDHSIDFAHVPVPAPLDDPPLGSGLPFGMFGGPDMPQYQELSFSVVGPQMEEDISDPEDEMSASEFDEME
ncbi:hypothetical protein P9112_010794 [Eukaryota sp. TZLM1-RC]